METAVQYAQELLEFNKYSMRGGRVQSVESCGRLEARLHMADGGTITVTGLFATQLNARLEHEKREINHGDDI